VRIPLVDLKKQYQGIKDEIKTAVEQVMEDTSFILGPYVEKFEKQIAGYHNTEYAVGVGSGTDALVLSLVACGIGKGDEVITSPFTFIATAEAISRVGATPVFCDIDEKTYNLDPGKIKDKITPSTKGIIPVHLYGLPCRMDRVLSLARQYGLRVIEDCAQAFGAEYEGTRVGALGDAGCLSFFPGKNLGAFGDGGMVVTNSNETAQTLRMLRNHGSTTKYFYGMHGFNSRLDSLQAAILQVKLPRMDQWIAKRRENADMYNHMLFNTDVVTPFIPEGSSHAFNYYTIRVRHGRDRVGAFLREKGIASAVYYPLCLHLQEIYKELGYETGDFPVAERLQNEVLSLPMCPELSREKIESVCQAVKEALDVDTSILT